MNEWMSEKIKTMFLKELFFVKIFFSIKCYKQISEVFFQQEAMDPPMQNEIISIGTRHLPNMSILPWDWLALLDKTLSR